MLDDIGKISSVKGMTVIHGYRYPEGAAPLHKIGCKPLGGRERKRLACAGMWRAYAWRQSLMAADTRYWTGTGRLRSMPRCRHSTSKWNKAGVDGQRVLASINSARASYLKAYLGRAEKQLRATQ